jgi:2-polyprenyl-3-methyl-5-hydroxy-6-metoxy-1,4-benzoquinol methylase
MACTSCCAIEDQFNEKIAKRELRKFRRRGPRKTTAMLLDLLQSTVKERRSLLDIGGGVGAIQHAMAASGTSDITSVDASPAYLAAAKSESEIRGYSDRALYVTGDFVEASERVPAADVVTMDRVICCYHDVDGLLGSAADKARHAVGLVFPREKFHVKVGLGVLNQIQALLGKELRAFAHPHSQVEKILTDRGFKFVSGGNSFVWRVAVYVK